MTRSTIVTMALGFSLIAVPAAIAASFPVKLLNALTSRQGYTVERGIAYGSQPRQKIDFYLPENVAADAPVVVFFYGGGWNRGAREDYLFVGQSLASAGFIVAIPDYRLYPEVVFPAFVADAAEAVGFVRDRFKMRGITERRLFLAGHSAGAHIAALLNLDEHYLAAAHVPRKAVAGVVGLSGPYDFLPLEEDIYKATFPGGGAGREPADCLRRWQRGSDAADYGRGRPNRPPRQYDAACRGDCGEGRCGGGQDLSRRQPCRHRRRARDRDAVAQSQTFATR